MKLYSRYFKAFNGQTEIFFAIVAIVAIVVCEDTDHCFDFWNGSILCKMKYVLACGRDSSEKPPETALGINSARCNEGACSG
jgi:hypothetical protein